MSTLRWFERVFLIIGIGCLGWAGATWVEAYRFQHQQGGVFEVSGRTSQRATAVRPDAVEAPAPIGRLRIPRVGVSVVVMPGDDHATLSKAVGHLSDTKFPWNGGNTALAGHRDTFFQPLERVQAGDEIHFETSRGRFQYRVRRTLVVEPEDLWVLDQSATPTLTLITCYPFRYIGPAPKRFIVQADRV